ncbi:MAG: hypothetical protein F4X48_01110 [Acidimicrobiia bacterium]|nr:hypothetical protein [Acidimicrobiia bacterium]MYC57179.1 hypothetical protein [Acidimicrobiia bacterium]MYI29897.1 hypothetical protein [Acidimicrobiia bacterium]
MVWCYQCGADFVDGVLECLECGVATFGAPPQLPENVGTEDEDQLAYELHEWPYERRDALEAELRNRKLQHAWIGPTLIIREHDEAEADEVVDVIN